MLGASALLVLACGRDAEPEAGGGGHGDTPALEADGQPVELPFALTDQSPDLMLTYADATGTHTVQRPSDVPEASREWVRVDSLSLSPDQRPADGQVYVVDLRERPADSRAARLVPRASFDAYVERASGNTGAAGGAQVATAGSGEIVLYGASWCGACRQARAFFEREGVAFVDRDIERDPGARDEMNRKGARRFAWRITAPTDELEDSEEAPAPPAPPVTPAKEAPQISFEKRREQVWAALERQCATLADEVMRAWEIADPVDQRAATIEVLQSASALGIAPTALDAFPVARVRLIRSEIQPAPHRQPILPAIEVG